MPAIDNSTEVFEMPANIAVLKKLISQLPSGVSRHTGAQIIKQTMEALGISMKSVLQDAQQVQESLKVSSVLPEFWLSDGEKSGLTSPLFSYPNVSPHGENAIRRKNHTSHFRVSDRCN